MDFNDFNNDNKEPLSEINMVPLIDVMLVLLILFIITAPLLTPHAVKIDVPQATSQAIEPNNIVLAIDEQGALYWNDKPIKEQDLNSRLSEAAQKNPQSELHLRASKTTEYQKLAEIMSSAQKAGITRIGFITESK
jgi:biopolymer transport protein ExbD